MTGFDYFDFDATDDEMYHLLMKRQKEAENKFFSSIIVDDQYINLFFVRSLITDPMLHDLPAIIQEFVPSHFDKLRTYDDLDDIMSLCDGVFDMPMAMNCMKLICLILNAARDGDASSVELLKYLFKSYHKAEYNNLKRFRTLTALDLVALSKEAGSTEQCVIAGHQLCLYITMAPFMGIEIKKDAEFGKLCNTFKESYEHHIADFRCSDVSDEPDSETYNEVCDEVESEIYFRYPEFCDFTKAVREYIGYVFTDLCANRELVNGLFLSDADKFIENCADTAAILHHLFPDKAADFSLHETVLFATIYNIISGIVERFKDERAFFQCLLGLNRGYQPQVFQSEKIAKPSAPTYKKVSETAAPVIMSEGASKEEEIEAYKAEILELRRRLREKESDVSHYKSESDELRRKNADLSRQIASCESEREELVALRNHVYEQSKEQPTESEETSFEEKKTAVSEKTVVIIGGNENWTKKLRNDFPKWRFVSPNASGTIPDNVCDNADMVYFFTDTLGHANYGRFVKKVREKQIPFGYIHGVNLQVNVSQVYRDLLQ